MWILLLCWSCCFRFGRFRFGYYYVYFLFCKSCLCHKLIYFTFRCRYAGFDVMLVLLFQIWMLQILMLLCWFCCFVGSSASLVLDATIYVGFAASSFWFLELVNSSSKILDHNTAYEQVIFIFCFSLFPCWCIQLPQISHAISFHIKFSHAPSGFHADALLPCFIILYNSFLVSSGLCCIFTDNFFKFLLILLVSYLIAYIILHFCTMPVIFINCYFAIFQQHECLLSGVMLTVLY